MKEALLYERLEQNKVKCGLCAHECLILPGRRGLCGVRVNQQGTLYSLVYGRAVSARVDPIEKKPLFHFFPASSSLSIAAVGCNFACSFCQNHDISQAPRESGEIFGNQLAPEAVAAAALSRGASSISYTYTEPTIYFEYALDIAREASRAGLKNVFVTNGYMSLRALEMIGPDLHAANVDLKAFNDDFYKTLCQARLEPVKRTIEAMIEAGVWVEVTTLLIPGKNDDVNELRDLAHWLAGVSRDIPWHISRFHPVYRLTDVPSTPVFTIETARKIGLAAGLKHVYSGNVWGDVGEKTFCPECKKLVIDRVGFSVSSNVLQEGTCPYCQNSIAGRWA